MMLKQEYHVLLKFAPMWFDPPLTESKNTEVNCVTKGIGIKWILILGSIPTCNFLMVCVPIVLKLR